MREVIKVIKENLNFKELPKDQQEAYINNNAEAMLLSFDEGVYTKKSALIDSKIHYTENAEDVKYVLYHSSIYGICSNEQEDFNREEY